MARFRFHHLFLISFLTPATYYILFNLSVFRIRTRLYKNQVYPQIWKRVRIQASITLPDILNNFFFTTGTYRTAELLNKKVELEEKCKIHPKSSFVVWTLMVILSNLKFVLMFLKVLGFGSIFGIRIRKAIEYEPQTRSGLNYALFSWKCPLNLAGRASSPCTPPYTPGLCSRYSPFNLTLTTSWQRLHSLCSTIHSWNL